MKTFLKDILFMRSFSRISLTNRDLDAKEHFNLIFCSINNKVITNS